jgi:hypothetical protein
MGQIEAPIFLSNIFLSESGQTEKCGTENGGLVAE